MNPEAIGQFSNDAPQMPGYHDLMADAAITNAIKDYAKAIRELLRVNPAIPETGLAPKFQNLISQLLPLLPSVPPLNVSPEYDHLGFGRPDIALKKQGEPARAFIELKAPPKPANPEQWTGVHNKRQYERLQELECWATCNFAAFHLFHRSAPAGEAMVAPVKALLADTPDKVADALIEARDAQPFLKLLEIMARANPPAATNAQHLAELLAHSARMVKSAVEEQVATLQVAGDEQAPLLMVRNTFKDVLYARPEVGGFGARDFDALFASAFAQTLAFGLLLVREATGAPVTADAWKHMPEEQTLMRAALRVLSEEEVIAQTGIGFDVMRDTVNSFAPEILAVGPDGRDPILYFYEDFLAIFDPVARERFGVYYTPVEVVRYMVGALDRALRDNLGTKGLRDPGVTILDPATGTGTFLLGIAERVRQQVQAEEGGNAAAVALRQLATRMFGFELLIGPYAVAHYRLHHALRYRPPDEEEDGPQPVDLPRLGIYLADTLSEPGAMAPIGQLGIPGIPIDSERAAANKIKTETEVIAIIGNPPYKRLAEGENETLVGRWMDGIWQDLKQPVKDAGKGGQLNTFPEFSVAFWRWALWKLFEADHAPQKGVIAFITNRKFLTGWPYAGLRQMMRQRFDRIEVIDLRGDVNAGPRGDVSGDQGVFNITVGTSITLAIADGSKVKGTLAAICYRDSWDDEIYSKDAKFEWLRQHASHGDIGNWIDIERAPLEDFRPTPFQNGEWLSIREAFLFSGSGVQTKRDKFAYSPNRNVLVDRISALVTWN